MKRKADILQQNVKRAKYTEDEANFLESEEESESGESSSGDFGGFFPADGLEGDEFELESGSDMDEEELKKLELASKMIEEEQARMEEEGRKELREGIEDKIKQTEESLKGMEAPNISLIKERMENILDVLADFKNLRQPDRSRADYIAQLQQDFCTFYGYNEELISIFMDIFSPLELKEFLETNDEERPVTIRTNTLKAKRKQVSKALSDRGVNLEPVGEWSKIGLKIYSSRIPIGATPEYLAGHYMLQSATSFLPVMALDPQPGEKVLDMAAAPGGKTSHIAQLMKNSGLLIANDINKSRLNALKSNLHRLGVANSVIVNFDGRKLPEHMKGFDRILLDAPCTGLGVISRDESIKQTRTQKDVWKLSKLQKELILAAIDMLEEKSQKATLVYSTCSVSVDENEDVVNYALKKRFVKLVPTGLPFGVEGFKACKEKRFHHSMKLTRRYYPHVHNLDGFFVAKFVKFRGGERAGDEDDDEKEMEYVSDEEKEKKVLPRKNKSSKKDKKKKKKKKKSKKS